MKYGIFGCTADPFTSAHYAIVNKVLKDKLVDKVVVIPTIVDYYRKDKERMFTNEQRLAIIKKWFNGREDVIVDDFEYLLADNVPALQKDRRYYHTLKSAMLRYDKGIHSGLIDREVPEFYSIVGADSWNNLESWYNFKELGSMTEFIVINRDGQPINYYINHEEYHAQPYKTISLDTRFTKVSATGLRKFLSVFSDPFDAYLNMIDVQLAEDDIDDTASEELIAHTPIFDLVRSEEVEAGFRPVKVKSPDWVAVVVEKDGKLLMEKQLRYGLNKEVEEFPCGMIEEGEFPAKAAIRELEEETGIKLKDERSLHYLGKFAANPAFMTNYMHYFHVNLDYALHEKTETKLDEHEHIESYWLDKKEAFENFIRSEGSSILGCMWMLLIKNNIVKV